MCAHAKTNVRLELAVEIIRDNPGMRPYRMASKFMKATEASRRTAVRFLARAREEIAKGQSDELKTLSAILPARLGDAMNRARDAGDLRAESALMRTAVELCGKLPTEPGATGPSRIDFFVWDGTGPQPVAEPDTS